MKRRKLRRQRPLQGGRDPHAMCSDPDVTRCILETQREFRCSKSFISHVAHRYFFGLPIEDDYREPLKGRRDG